MSIGLVSDGVALVCYNLRFLVWSMYPRPYMGDGRRPPPQGGGTLWCGRGLLSLTFVVMEFGPVGYCAPLQLQPRPGV